MTGGPGEGRPEGLRHTHRDGRPLWLRAAMRLLPRSFRANFGESLSDAASRIDRDHRAGGRVRHATYVLRELTGLLWLSLTTTSGQPHPHSPHTTGATMFETLRAEVLWAISYTRRRPTFALAVTVTLAASIGAAATAFGLAHAVLWRTLPFADESRLVFVWEERDGDGLARFSRVTGARYAAWRDVRGVFSSTALFGAAGFTLERPDGAVSVRGVRVSAAYFATLGVRPTMGRTFTWADEQPGKDRVAILSSAFWQQQFGGRQDVVGETIKLSGEPYTVIGVMPPLTFPAWAVNPANVTLDPDLRQLWVPIARDAALDTASGAHVFGMIARLAPAIAAADAVTRLNVTSKANAPDPHRAHLTPLRQQFVAEARLPLLVLAAATLSVWLIACANLAALYASAFEARRGELAVRVALGAGAVRLARQLAIETLIPVIAGTLFGLLITRTTLAAIPALLPPDVPFLTPPSVDVTVVVFASALAVLATTLLVAWPVKRLVSLASPRGVVPQPRRSMHRTLVVAQVAVTVALAVAGALLGQSLVAIRRQPTGFAVNRVLVANVGLTQATSDASRITALEQRVLGAVAAMPGVTAVAAAYDHPLEANWSESPTVSGDGTSARAPRQVELRIVSPGYFEALDVQVLDGRTFSDRDVIGVQGVVVVNEAFAQLLGHAVGRRLQSGTPRFTFNQAPAEFEIVGVVANERMRGLEQPTQPAYYLSTRQFPQNGVVLLARTAGDPIDAGAALRPAIRALDPSMTVEHVTSLEQILDDQLASRRLTSDVIGGFALAAVALAALGMYGLLAVLVSSRMRDLGVRLAIGASPASVAGLVIGDSVRSALTGIAIGLVLALVAGQLIHGLLVGVSPRDPLTLAVVSATMLGVAAAAALLPARRAARIDPVDALRAE